MKEKRDFIEVAFDCFAVCVLICIVSFLIVGLFSVAKAQTVNFKADVTEQITRIYVTHSPDFDDTVCAISIKFQYDTSLFIYTQAIALDSAMGTSYVLWNNYYNTFALAYFALSANMGIVPDDTIIGLAYINKKAGCGDFIFLPNSWDNEINDCDGNTFGFTFGDTTVCNYSVTTGIDEIDRRQRALTPYDITGRTGTRSPVMVGKRSKSLMLAR